MPSDFPALNTSPTIPSSLSAEQLGSMGYTQTLRPHSSGVSIIIVGCGFAGLACAIESVRKGHKVIVLEKYKELKMLGDVSSPSPDTDITSILMWRIVWWMLDDLIWLQYRAILYAMGFT